MFSVEIDDNNRSWFEKPENILFFELCIAYLEARLAKRDTYDEQKFEMNAAVNLQNLLQSILNRDYHPNHTVVHLMHTPVLREVFVAPFRDRVVHHFLYDNSYEWWDRRLIYDSYACREGKGTLLGLQRMARNIQAVSDNYRKEAWVFKFDISGYYMHLPREGLYERVLWGLDRQFADDKGWRYETLKYLWRQVIIDDPCDGVFRRGPDSEWRKLSPGKSLFAQPPGRGIVIGNLTSQLLSNIYLDILDRYIIFDLGFKHYGRYVDDFYFVVDETELERAKRSIPAIATRLESLKLTLHPTKTKIMKASQGINFLGAVVYPGRIVVGKRLKTNFRKAMSEVMVGKRTLDSIPSYYGHLKYLKSWHLMDKVFEEMGWL